MVLYPLEVPHSVAVRIGKAIDKQLIGGGSPLVAVKGRRLGHNGLGLFLFPGALAHRNLLGKGTTGYLQFSLPRIRAIRIHTHTDNSITISGRRSNVQPVITGRHGPTAGGCHLNGLGSRLISGKRQRGRAYRQSILRRSFLVAAGHYRKDCNQYPKMLFHIHRC